MAKNIKNTFSVDASFVLAYLLPDEKSEKVDEYFDRYCRGEINLISSSLLPFEVINALRTAVLRNRLDKDKAILLAKSFIDLDIYKVEDNFLECLKQALKNNITVYDASYLNVALTYKTVLLSLDRNLIKISEGN